MIIDQSFTQHAPTIIENTGSGKRTYDIYSRLLKDRIVFINGPINMQMANSTVAQLLFLKNEQPKAPISIYINSPGGSIYAGLAIYDTMQFLNNEITTVCVGLAASMAAVLLSAGTVGKRLSLPHSRIMIHQPSGGAVGMASDIEIQTNEILFLKKQMNGILSTHTGKTIAKIAKDTDRDNFMSAVDAVKYGLIDRVIAKADV